MSTHFSTEWDWMDFYWNLWTEGGTSNRYTVSQMNLIWNGVWAIGEPPGCEIAIMCCATGGDGDPTGCVQRDLDLIDDCGEGTYAAYPTEHEVGRLWSNDTEHGVDEGVKEDAQDLYFGSNPLKYNHFVNTGDATGVDH